MVLVDGRKDTSRGMSLEELSKLFEDLGCKKAYNLDGGHCSFMTLQDRIADHPYKPEHEVSDGIFILDDTVCIVSGCCSTENHKQGLLS